MHESPPSQTAVGLLRTLIRRWRIVVPFVVVTPLVALAFSASLPRTYESSAAVLLDRRATVISGLHDPTLWTPVRTIRTQAALARLPEVARRVIVAGGVEELGAFEFLAKASVVADGLTDLLTFVVRDEDPDRASQLATLYAEQYIAYRTELDTQSLRRAIAVVGSQLERSRALQADPVAYADLVKRHQQLHIALAGLEMNASLVRPAGSATPDGPWPVHTSILALVLGLVVGVGLALLVALLDPRARTASEISEQLGLPLLGQLPLERPGRHGKSGVAMLLRDDGPSVEAMQALRTSLEIDPRARQHVTIMVTSAVAGEGKSTTAANLAVALARVGRSVVLVDLDVHRPRVARLFDLPKSPGIIDAIRGTAELTEVLRDISLDWPGEPTRDGSSRGASTIGRLRVAVAGAALPADTSVLGERSLPRTLEELRELADVVLVDSPPLLRSSDAFALSEHVDGLLVVAHSNLYRSSYAPELSRLLAVTPAVPIGLVVVGEAREGELAYRYRPPSPRPFDRAARTLGRA